MVKFQLQLQKTAQITAKNVFDNLDDSLDPKVYIIGIPTENGDHGAAYIYQENSVYEPTMFPNVRKKTRLYKELEGQSDCMFCFFLEDEKIAKCPLYKEPIREIIQKYIDGNQAHDTIPICSEIVVIDNYIVFVLIHFAKEAYQSHYSLFKSQKNQNFQAYSLIHATAIEFLHECEKALQLEQLGNVDKVSNRDGYEIIRSGGRHLTNKLAFACDKKEGAFDLYDAFNTISSLRYEGSACIGKILLSKKGHQNIKETLRFSSPIRLNDYRAVRKLLEMTKLDSYLLSDAHDIYGTGFTIGSYDQRSENLFSINFTKHYTWELRHAENILMKIAYGQPELPKPLIQEREFTAMLQQKFTNISNMEVELLWKIIDEASRQEHGTMVVVYEDAVLESKRLQQQATRIEPIQLTPKIVNAITAIDGAILVDQKSTCYAIGVILDGLASDKGDPSRGARYNSAIRFVDSVDKPCLAVVVSEDGSIDLVHNA